MTPVLYAAQMPASVRLFLVIGLALIVQAAHPSEPADLPRDFVGLLRASARELALGATLGFGVHVAFATFAMAGRLLDIQVGFGMAQVLDPMTHRQIPILTSIFSQLGVLVFFLLDGHHALFRGVDLSLRAFPLGADWSIASAADEVLGQMGGLFMLGFAMVAPVVFCVLVVELALGVVARNLPQMNIFLIALPLKIAITFVALAVWFSAIGGVMNRAYAAIGTNWERLMVPGVSNQAPQESQ